MPRHVFLCWLFAQLYLIGPVIEIDSLGNCKLLLLSYEGIRTAFSFKWFSLSTTKAERGCWRIRSTGRCFIPAFIPWVEMRRKGKNEQLAAELVHMLGALVKTIGAKLLYRKSSSHGLKSLATFLVDWLVKRCVVMNEKKKRLRSWTKERASCERCAPGICFLSKISYRV